MFLFCPYRDSNRDWQHRQTNDGEAGDRKHKIAYQPVQHFEVLATQREAPLQQQQPKKHGRQQRSADVIH